MIALSECRPQGEATALSALESSQNKVDGNMPKAEESHPRYKRKSSAKRRRINRKNLNDLSDAELYTYIQLRTLGL